MSTTVAKGSVVLTLDANQLNTGMKKQAMKAKQDGKTIGENFKSSAGDILKDSTGGDKGIFGMGLKAGLIGAGIAGAAWIGKELFDSINPIKELEKELERASEINAKWREGIATSIAVEKEWIASLGAIAGTAAGMKEFESRLGSIKSKVGTLDTSLRDATKTNEELDSKWSSMDNFGTWLTGGLETKQKAAQKEVELAKAARDAADKEAKDIAKQLERLKNPLTNPQAVQAHRDFIRDLQYSTAEIQGQSAEYSKLLRMKEQFNLTAGQMGEALAAISAKEMAQRGKEADDMIKTLTKDVMAFGEVVKKTAEEEKLDELVKAGLDMDKAARIKGLIQLKKLEAQQYKPLTALVRGTAAEIGFRNKDRFEQDRNKAVEKLLEEMKKANKIAAETRDAAVITAKKEPALI